MKTIERKALEVIEVMTATASESVNEQCYKFAHVALGRCKHLDWEEELNIIHDKMTQAGGIK